MIVRVKVFEAPHVAKKTHFPSGRRRAKPISELIAEDLVTIEYLRGWGTSAELMRILSWPL